MVINMEKINEDKLEQIKGGTTEGVWIGIGVAALCIFISGIIQGIVNPEK